MPFFTGSSVFCKKVIKKIKLIPYFIRCANIKRFVIKTPYQFGLNKGNLSGQKLIVSLTSYPARFPYLELCLKSLLLQTHKPDAIFIWLDCRREEVSQNILRLEKYGITFRFDCEDLKCHKKYFFAMQEFPDDIIITVDDDVLYPKDTIEVLVKMHKKYPDCVIARRAHKMTFNSMGKLNPYNEWIDKCRSVRETSYLLVPTGVGGVLYPPRCLDERVFDTQTIIKNCLLADDIWLKTMGLLHGTEVVWAPNHVLTPPASGESQKTALYLTNVLENKNDVYIKNMEKLFGDEVHAIISSRL